MIPSKINVFELHVFCGNYKLSKWHEELIMKGEFHCQNLTKQWVRVFPTLIPFFILKREF